MFVTTFWNKKSFLIKSEWFWSKKILFEKKTARYSEYFGEYMWLKHGSGKAGVGFSSSWGSEYC